MKKSPSVAFSLNAKLNFKVIIVGNKNVGKTSLILRYIKNQFDFNYKVTIGVEFYSKIIQHNEDEVALQIWDTSGNENHKSIVRSFYNFANCVILVYDHPRDMRQIIDNWIYQINEYVMEPTRLVLVRTKTDSVPIEPEQQACADELVQKYGIDMFVGVSAKDNKNVQELFTNVAVNMKKLYKKNPQFREFVDHKQNSMILTLETEPGSKGKGMRKKKCCES